MKNTFKYNFKYHTTASDLWQLSLYGIYGSILGVVNVIFTVAMILLTIKIWNDVHIAIKILLVLAICLFTIIQPIVVYFRAKKQALNFPDEVNIAFGEEGIRVKIENKSSDLKWKSIKGVLKKPSMIVIISTGKHGFVLTNKVLGDQKEVFYDYVNAKIKK